VPVSLATVYNTLRQFTEAGLLRQIAVDASKTSFDTKLTEHHHFMIEGEEELMDIRARRSSWADTFCPRLFCRIVFFAKAGPQFRIVLQGFA
jgi:Fe2+ or Zn2+ uptake regulation protein